MYTDDIIIHLFEPEQSIETLMKAIEEFGAISGYTLNINESEVMIMRSSISNEIKPKYPFYWM